MRAIGEGALDKQFLKLYGTMQEPRERYARCVEAHIRQFGEKEELWLFSSPGRVGLCGSHTDYQNGRVLAGAVDADIICAVGPNEHSMLRVASDGFRTESVDLWDLRLKDRERGRPTSLIRGIAAGVKKRGYILSGYDIYASSSLQSGEGLASSAAFELLVASALNSLFCEEALSPVELAIIANQAENEYYGRSCSLMNQTACAVGDCVLLDLKNPHTPSGERLDFNLSSYGYHLLSINCGVSHAYLEDDLAAIPADMRAVAQCMGKEHLRQIEPDEFYQSISFLRRRAGDKAVLRAAHFFDESDRALKMAKAIKAGRIEDFFRLVRESDASSHALLQNVYSEHNPREQGVSVALCLARRLLQKNGACRIQGNGFSGAVQAYVRDEQLSTFIAQMEAVFGDGSCRVLRIRQEGAMRIF